MLNQRPTAFPPLPGGLTALHGDSRESMAMMSEAVDEAARSVHVAIDIMSPDPFTRPFVDALGRAAGRGVDVRVACTGSMNMIDPHDENRGNERSGRQWVDTMGRYEGPTTPPR